MWLSEVGKEQAANDAKVKTTNATLLARTQLQGLPGKNQGGIEGGQAQPRLELHRHRQHAPVPHRICNVCKPLSVNIVSSERLQRRLQRWAGSSALLDVVPGHGAWVPARQRLCDH